MKLKRKPVIISIIVFILVIAFVFLFVTLGSLKFGVGTFDVNAADVDKKGYIEYVYTGKTVFFSGLLNKDKAEKYSIQTSSMLFEQCDKWYQKFSYAEIDCDIISQSTNKVVAQYSGYGIDKSSGEREEVFVRAVYTINGYRKKPVVEYTEL
ncbi:MAG: hypothetical protein WC900_08395 [Oscillospiraceae bacterium]|jgi:hypothetical protein